MKLFNLGASMPENHGDLTDIDPVNDCKIFKYSFDYSIWKDEKRLSYLKSNITTTDKVMKEYLGKIEKDFPNLTDHSLNHSKMLWKYTDRIIGDKQKFINPLEAFILHIVFLIHDSGMCYSILNNKDEIESDPLYLDYIRQYGDTSENRYEALFLVVRYRHGDFAERIATEQFSNGRYLLVDDDLQSEFGSLIGKISKSHTKNINYIEREFSSPYCSPLFPNDWALDCQKLSYILRVADAADIDNLRTPKSLELISKMKGISREHWIFQKKLGFPSLDDGTLVYTTNSAFSKEEQKAWWFCYNALYDLDKELKDANEFFKSRKTDGFSAKGVKSISNTLELGEHYIKTNGWVSIDTTIKVSNPAHIATELGGERLYGDTKIAIRELIQNSIDAINLHRVSTGQNDNLNVGEIDVKLEEYNDEYYLIVTDDGIGMSQSLLTNELLDFGGSYWKSDKFKYEFQGAKYKGFESIGQFGIGFFSVFMLGKEITVTSWKFGESIERMKTLDFYDGINATPILRESTQAEKNTIRNHGTSIRIKLNNAPYSQIGILTNPNWRNNTLFDIVKYFVPASNIKINIFDLDGNTRTIPPNYIYNLSFEQLLDYNYFPQKNSIPNFIPYPIQLLNSLGLDLIELKNEKDEIIGKLVVIPNNISNENAMFAMAISKGIRIKELVGFAGYICTAEVISIKRDVFPQIITYDCLKAWAIKQKEMIEGNAMLSQLLISQYLGLCFSFSLFDDNFPIFNLKKGNVYSSISMSCFKQKLETLSEINIYSEGRANLLPDCDGFLYLNVGINLSEIIRKEDFYKLLTYENLIENTVRAIWGDFIVERNDLISDTFFTSRNPFDVPYIHQIIYRRGKAP